jgi:hypothetical protein
MAGMGFAYLFMGGGEDKKAAAAPAVGDGGEDKIMAQNKDTYAKLQKFNQENKPWDAAFYNALKREGSGR